MRLSIIICFFLSLQMTVSSKEKCVISKTDSSVTFSVNPGLSPQKELGHKKSYKEVLSMINDKYVNPQKIMGEEKVSELFGKGINPYDYVEPKVLASSIKKDSLYFQSNDVFYNCIISAFASHRPVVLSPDMVWIIISQGFSRYIENNSEKVRCEIVNHPGYDTLKIYIKKPLTKINDSDWLAIIDSFSAQIEGKTKKDIAATIKCNFSTTTSVDRIASEITLLKCTENYFKLEIISVTCGFPYITLKGTPDDWKSVLEKTKELSKYGLGHWVDKLEPILNEFIKASEGNPDQVFWSNMVMKSHTDKLVYPSCMPKSESEKTTEFDGWILNFFPNKYGYTLDKVDITQNMPDDQTRVNCIHKDSTLKESKVEEVNLEFISGFVGYDIDSDGAIIPRIGWIIQKKKGEPWE